MQNSAKTFVVLVALVACGMAAADPTSDKLTQIEAETLLLKARERQLEVQANILSRQNEIATKQNLSTALAHNAVVGDPVIVAIEGIGNKLFATLQLNDGNIVDVQAGDTLSNGMQIASVSHGAVIVQNGKRRVRLARQQVIRPAAFNPNVPSPGVVVPLPPAAPRGVAR
ncbi:MAG TPA: type IV pilus biogenesis protein PilP [Noviherbaspirillum sp.]